MPEGFDTTTIESNTQRFVTHRDLHATWLGLLGPSHSQTGVQGFDLLRQELPERRSCAEAGIPKQWCNCFMPRRATNETRCQVDGYGDVGGNCP